MGKRNKISHIVCRRCGRHSFSVTNKHCSACGFPSPKLRKFNWQWKTITRERKK